MWNVLRYLQKVGRLDIITRELGIGEPRGLLLWGLAPEPDGKSAELQYVTGDLLRRFDATFAEGVTEPDVTLLGTTGIAVAMGVSQLRQDERHLWEGSLEQVGQLQAYREQHPAFIKEDVNDSELISVLVDNDLTSVYQFVKLAIFAKELGAHFGVEPMVVALASSKYFLEKNTESGWSAADRWNTFVDILGENAIKCKELLWQDILGLKIDPAALVLSQYLLTHPYLYDVTDQLYAVDSATY